MISLYKENSKSCLGQGSKLGKEEFLPYTIFQTLGKGMKIKLIG